MSPGPTPHAVARAAGLRLSVAQSCALKAIGGEPLTPDELRRFRDLSAAPKGLPHGPYREAWVRAGRRSGKTLRLGAPFAVSALLSNVDGILAPGEKARVLAIGPTLPHTRTLLDGIAGLLSKLGIAHVPKELEIELPGRRTRVVATVADHLGARSGTAIAAIVDEAALLPFDEGADGFDQEVFAAIRPSLATTKGKLLVLSSPWARRGEHFETIERHLGKPAGDVLALHGATWLWHPEITEAETRKLEKNPARWKREWAGIAGATEESAFAAEDIARAIPRGVKERAPEPGVFYGSAGDLAFRSDGAVLGIAHKVSKKVQGAPNVTRIVLDALRVKRARPGETLDPERLIEEWATTLRRYGVRRLWLDSFGFDLAASRFKARGIRCELLKMDLGAQALRYDALGGRLRAGSISLLESELLKRELSDLRVELLPAGKVRFEAPRRKAASDDCADVIAALCGEATTGLATGGEGAGVETRVHWNSTGLHAKTTYFDLVKGPAGTLVRMPSGPAVGTEEWIALRTEQKSQGIHVMGEPDVDDYLAGAGTAADE